MAVNVTRGTGFLESFLAKQRAKTAKKHIPVDYYSGRILDIGCGAFPLFLSDIDFNEKYAIEKEETKDFPRNINCVKFDINSSEKLPFDSNYFNSVTALALIEHIDAGSISHFTDEVYRILDKKGIFILTTPARWVDIILKIMAFFNIVSKEEINEHKSLFTRRKIKQILLNAGFREIQTGYFELFMNIIAVAKK